MDEEITALKAATAILVSVKIGMKWEDVFGQTFEEIHHFQGGEDAPVHDRWLKLREYFPFDLNHSEIDQGECKGGLA